MARAVTTVTKVKIRWDKAIYDLTIYDVRLKLLLGIFNRTSINQSNRKSFNPLTVNIIVDLFNYSRRETSEVNIGATPMGGSNPIRIQSMTNTATQDTEASVAQAKRIVDAGGEYVRLTAQGIKEAENLMNINIGLRQDGYMVPLVADIHFNPKVAERGGHSM